MKITTRWATPKIDRPDQLDDVVWAMRYLAQMLDDDGRTEQWLGVALGLVPRLDSHARKRLLTAPWPETLRDSVSWSTTALGTLAQPELAHSSWPRRDPLLVELLERPASVVKRPRPPASSLVRSAEPPLVAHP